MVPKTAPVEHVDVTAAMYEAPTGQPLADDLLLANLHLVEEVQ